MSKIEIVAIRTMPKKYVKDGTCVCRVGACAVVMAADLEPLFIDALYRMRKLKPNLPTRKAI